MMLAVLLPALALAQEVADAPPMVSARVWPDDPGGIPAIAEHFPEVPAGLGAQAALHGLSLDGCWRQHAALTGDLHLWFCADLKVNKKGAAKAKVTALSDPRPGLETCIDATLQSWAGPPGAPAKATLCRAVHTHLSDTAREVWAADPWATVAGPGRQSTPADAPAVEVGRPAIEKAARLERDPSSGDLVRTPSPLALRDRPVTTARRYLTANKDTLSGCWADHAGWRPPEEPATDSALVAFTLDITVGEAGPEAVAAGRAVPLTHHSVATCAAARLDPGVGASEGSVVIEVPVSFQR